MLNNKYFCFLITEYLLFRPYIFGHILIFKAAGGVKSREDLEMFLDAGCDRIGTSSAVKMLEIE